MSIEDARTVQRTSNELLSAPNSLKAQSLMYETAQSLCMILCLGKDQHYEALFLHKVLSCQTLFLSFNVIIHLSAL